MTSLHNGLHVAVVCASNQNRSMEAHRRLLELGFDVKSFGTNSLVKLPGPSIDRPNVYPFGTSYDAMKRDLMKKNSALYASNGLLALMERNAAIKPAPERFQSSIAVFDVIVTFDVPIFQLVCGDLESRGDETHEPVHVFNISVKDNAEEAKFGGEATVDLLTLIVQRPDWDDHVDAILEDFEAIQASKRRIVRTLHQICFY